MNKADMEGNRLSGAWPTQRLTQPMPETDLIKPGLEIGIDELNLAEFPLAAISDRFFDGKKTVVFEDTVYCRDQRRELPRRLTISGSDRYGLPTATDDDVLLACIQISKLGGFASPEVHFSRYEIIKLLRWGDESQNYERVATSLRRWKGLTIFSDRAFYDHERKSWVNRDFGVFDRLTIYRRESSEGVNAPASSSFVWNEVMFRSFQAGYLKRLDWGLYTSLQSAIAKRLYRFLDKRFYRSKHLELDLRELSIHKIRLSSEYNVSQMKRELQKGFEELETRWDLEPLPPEQRFQKVGKGNWKVILERKISKSRAVIVQSTVQTVLPTLPVHDENQLVSELCKRGIGPGAADDLVSGCPLSTIQTMIELYDWYNNKGQERSPGFLVNAIKNPTNIGYPKGFEPSTVTYAKKAAQKNRIDQERELRTKRERDHAKKQSVRLRAFLAFWETLRTNQQEEFEREALESAEPTKRHGYLRSMGKETSPVFEQYRSIILRDHFERIHATVLSENELLVGTMGKLRST